MKTTRSNSFRLHRITKGSSLKKWNEGDSLSINELSFKLDVIHSVNKGVKYNDLSYITGKDLNILRKQPLNQTNPAYESAEMNLADMRKKYDEMKKKSFNLSKAIFHLKEQKQRYLMKLQGIGGEKEKGQDKVQSLQVKLAQKKLSLTEVQAQRNVLKNMVQRHYTDKVFYDQRKSYLDQQYSHLKKQLKIFVKGGTGIEQNTDRAAKVYEKFIKQLQAEKEQREEHLKNIEKLLFAKASILQSNQIRGLEIEQIALRAMLDKNQNEKQWQKIFFTHKLLSHMLRSKIQREMEKFSVVQLSFKEIKTATGVGEAQTFVKKFLNKEETYGDLLCKISQNEKHIQILKGQTESLLMEQKNLESEREIFQSMKVTQPNFHNDYKELQAFQNKSLSTELLRTKFITWLERQLKKFALFDKKRGSSNEKLNIIELFKVFSQKLLESLENLEPNQGNYELSLKDEANIKKIVRISPKKPKKNDKGQEIYDFDEQEVKSPNLDKMLTYEAEQYDLLANQRDQVLKTNERFMKELRRKREEMRKVLVEVMQKQKKQKPKMDVKKEE